MQAPTSYPYIPGDGVSSAVTGSKAAKKSSAQRSETKLLIPVAGLSATNADCSSSSDTNRKDINRDDRRSLGQVRPRLIPPNLGPSGNGYAFKRSAAPSTVASTPSPAVMNSSGPKLLKRGEMAGNNSEREKMGGDYGIVISLKEKFGFLQPLDSEEQVYFADREGYSGISIGDEVSYIKRASSRGFNAERLRKVVEINKQFITDMKGLVFREPDIHRGTPGLIQLSEDSLKHPLNVGVVDKRVQQLFQEISRGNYFVPYLHEDITSTGGSIGSRRILKGDDVDFTLACIPATGYVRAKVVNCFRRKKDRIMADQIQRMLDAGATREQGVVDSVKNDEFGFIRSVNRTDQIYFRLDDIMDDSASISEGTELEFFVIVESVKGKMSDRAVHLTVIPKGTVRFEVTIAENVLAVVASETKSYPQEMPGSLRLKEPITWQNPFDLSQGPAVLTHVELWQRCLPDNLQVAVGDVVSIDIQYYRPEKLTFARSVVVKAFRKVTREAGTICLIKENGFGFITSYIRDMDLYFRTSEVFGLHSEVVPEKALKVGDVLSFDVTVDDNDHHRGGGNSGGAWKLKAIRVQLCSCSTNQLASFPNANQAWNFPSAIPFVSMSAIDFKFTKINSHLVGTVLRDANAKRDIVGQIKPLPSSALASFDSNNVATYFPEIRDAIQDFLDTPEHSEVPLKYLVNNQRKAIGSVVDSLFSNSIFMESSVDATSGNKILVLKKKVTTGESDKINTTTTTVTAATTKAEAKNSHRSLAEEDIVIFQRPDVNEIFGLIAKELEVSFDLYFDRKTHKRIAKEIKLTDQAILDDGQESSKRCFGVIDVVVGAKSGKFGFIRRIPSDEKVYWHSSGFLGHDPGTSTASPAFLMPINIDTVAECQCVSFSLRRRGGMRCAVDIIIIQLAALSKELLLDGVCVALAVEKSHAVILDPSNCPLLASKLWSIDIVQTLSLAANSIVENTVNAESAGAAENQTKQDTLDAQQLQEGLQAVSISSDAKYFALLGRQAIPLMTVCGGYEPQPGDVISCQAVVNWAVQRGPLMFQNINKLASSQPPVGEKMKGQINRLKFKGSESSPKNPTSSMEFCEIRVSSEADNSVNNKDPTSGLYYCLVSELSSQTEFSRDSIQVGDTVEFWAVKGINLAVAIAPVVIPKSTTISYARRNFNTELKQTQSKSGFKGISMAQGPPNESAVGFASSWREIPDVSKLPWGHLLSHLNPI